MFREEKNASCLIFSQRSNFRLVFNLLSGEILVGIRPTVTRQIAAKKHSDADRTSQVSVSHINTREGLLRRPNVENRIY